MFRAVLNGLACLIFWSVSISICSALPPSEYPGDGVDDTGTNPPPVAGICPAGYHLAYDLISCDADFVANDHDGDRYTTDGTGYYSPAVDCDDGRRDIYLGISVACTVSTPNDGIKTCQANGTYTPCSTTPLCEKTGSGHCYYINPSTGSDSNNGSFATPFKTLQAVTRCAIGCVPGNVALVPGDVIYLFTGTYTDTSVLSSQRAGLIVRSVTPTAANKLTFKAYPGNHPLMDFTCDNISPCVSVYVFIVPYTKFEGIEIIGGFSTAMVFTDSSSNAEISNMHIHHIRGNAANNTAGISIGASTDNVLMHHNWIHNIGDFVAATANGTQTGVTTINMTGPILANVNDDLYFINRATGQEVSRRITSLTPTSVSFTGIASVNDGDKFGVGGAQNKTQIVLFRGTGNKTLFNTLYGAIGSHLYTADNASSNCYKYKHASGDASQTQLVQGNTIFNCLQNPIQSALSGTFTGNLLDLTGVPQAGILMQDVGGPTNFRPPTIINYNTILGGPRALAYIPNLNYTTAGTACSGCMAPGTVSVDHNITDGAANSWSTLVDGVINICPRGSDAYKTIIIDGGLFNIHDNCWWNSGSAGWYSNQFGSGTAPVTGLCTTSSGDPAGAGTAYPNFSGPGSWQTAGWDLGSFFKNSVLNSRWQATDSDCQNFGYSLQSGATTTTVTTTTSVSTTSTGSSTSTTSTTSTSATTTSVTTTSVTTTSVTTTSVTSTTTTGSSTTTTAPPGAPGAGKNKSQHSFKVQTGR